MDISQQQKNLFLFAFLAIGILLRGYFPFWTSSFLVHDGGLHLQLGQELIANDLRLPRATDYNRLSIPFVYPPLSTYLLAITSQASGWEISSILRFLPAFIACLTIIAAFRLFEEILRLNWQRVVAGALFCFLPEAFCQLVKSGGISRGLGALFCLLAMREVVRVFRCSTIAPPIILPQRSLVILSLLLAATALSHPEWTLALLLFMLSALICNPCCRASLAAAVLFSGVLTAPWWALMLWQHGLVPFWAAASSGTHSINLSALGTLQLFPLSVNSGFHFLGMTGILVCVARREYFMVVFLLLGGVLQTRGFRWVVVVPFAYFVAIGLEQVFALLFPPPGKSNLQGYASEWQPRTMRIVIALLLAYALAEGVSLARQDRPELQSASAPMVEAFQWVRENTAQSSKFILLTGLPWWVDYSNELFPAMAGRQSLTTCQGREWLDGGRFHECLMLVAELQNPFDGSRSEIVSQILSRADIDFLLGMKKAFSSKAIAAILGDRYEVVFENQEVLIFKHRSPLGPGVTQGLDF
ncbi:MAG: hypothetical protein J0M12_03705 [Deltaproteobacteria bacterium]|nr:hypothetical protein [Deltaproteobacteria bacterium]